MRHALLLAFLLAGPACAGDTRGFSADDLAAAARAAHPAEALADAREYVAQTETLRAAFVLGPAAGWKLLSASEARNLRLAFGPSHPAEDDALQWFMRGASAGAGDGAMTGLYNPLADAWLILRWQRIGGAPRIADAVFLPGAALRDVSDRTPWTERPGRFTDALAGNTAVARLTFAALDANRFFATVAPLKAQAGDEAFASITPWLGSLRPWGEDKVRLAQWKTLHRRLAGGQTGAPVSSLPPQIRASLIPMGAIRHDGGDALLLVSPLAPQILVAADYGARSTPDLYLVNLANARTEAAQ